MVIAPDAALPRVQLKTQLTSKHHNKLPISCDTSVDKTRKDNKMLNHDVKRHIMVIEKQLAYVCVSYLSITVEIVRQILFHSQYIRPDRQ